MVAPAVSGPAAAASALRTPVSGSAPSAARLPAARPERRRNVRRSRLPREFSVSAAASVPRRDWVWRSARLISTAPSLLRVRIAVDVVIGLHVVGFLVAGLALVIVVLGVGARLARERGRHGGGAGAEAERAQDIATAEFRLLVLLHGRVLLEGVVALRLTTAA